MTFTAYLRTMSRKIQRHITSETQLAWFSAVCHKQWSERNERHSRLRREVAVERSGSCRDTMEPRGRERHRRANRESNGAFGKSDIEGKAAREAASERGQRTSFKRVIVDRSWRRDLPPLKLAPALGFDSEFRFQRVVLLEFAYAKDAEANNAAVFVHPLHNGVILRLTHVPAHQRRRLRGSRFPGRTTVSLCRP
jgi:hypothetical protein